MVLCDHKFPREWTWPQPGSNPRHLGTGESYHNVRDLLAQPSRSLTYNNSRPSLKPNCPDLAYQILLVLMESHMHSVHGFHLSKLNFNQINSLKLMLLTMFGINWSSHSKLQSYTSDSQQKRHSAGTQRLSSSFFSTSATIHKKIRKQSNASPLYNSAIKSPLSPI